MCAGSAGVPARFAKALARTPMEQQDRKGYSLYITSTCGSIKKKLLLLSFIAVLQAKKHHVNQLGRRKHALPVKDHDMSLEHVFVVIQSSTHNCYK
jgi:hypothetical protein